MKHIVLLGSTSTSRQLLLQESKIPFKLIGQSADETLCDWGLPLVQVVTSIALYKMAHVIMPNKLDEDVCFVLTADTLSQDSTGRITGKPANKEEAVMMIKRARAGMRTATAFCLERKKRTSEGAWETDQKIVEHAQAAYVFDVPDNWIDTYFKHSAGFTSSGSIAIEGYGGQFLRELSGSCSAVVGLPLFQVRQALERLGFFGEQSI